MPAPGALKVARTPDGLCLRVEGRGTMRESRSAAEFVVQSLAAEPAPTIRIDLSACDHLDSTFLGCLVDMHRRAGKDTPPRFTVFAPPEKVHKLLYPMRLDLVLKTADRPPDVVGEFLTLPAAEPGTPDVMRHVMECHRLLASVGGPQKAVFTAIADNLERELNKGRAEKRG